MRTQRFAVVTALALPFAFGSFGYSYAHAQPAVGTPAALQDNGAPDPYRDARERGRHDGERAAYDDMHHGLAPDPNRHHEFRHPPVDHRFDDAYRKGFRHGYHDAFHHGEGH